MDTSESIKQLKNTYFVLRQGKSEANVKGIIISNLIEGKVSYGLVEEGKKQVCKRQG